LSRGIFSLGKAITLAILITSASFAVTITQAEYFFNTDPGQGLATPITITPGADISISGLVVPPTGLLPDRIHKLNLRFRSDEGYWSFAEGRFFFILSGGAPVVDTVRVVQAEYWFDALTATTVDIPDGQTSVYAALVPTAVLTVDRLHTFSTRYLDDNGLWSATETRYFFIVSGLTPVVDTLRVVQAEYWFDALPATTVDVPDGQTSAYVADIPAAGLTIDRLHTFSLRYLDDNGVWSAPATRYFYLLQGGPGTVQYRVVTDLEYWIDSSPPTPLDLADAATVSFNSLIPSTGLSSGLHHFNIRYRDDTGAWSMAEARNFVVISQTAPAGPPSFLTAAEYYINGNPAPGSGVPILLPQDGSWNEHDEETAVVITNLPVGLHRFCLRYRDEQGTWSSAFCDSVVMSPVLVIRPSGPNVILTWQADTTHIPFTIYRADNVVGPFNQIAQTNLTTYTDSVAPADIRKYYRVTTTTSALSTFRMPAQSALPPRD
jgi:hypothetical protein